MEKTKILTHFLIWKHKHISERNFVVLFKYIGRFKESVAWNLRVIKDEKYHGFISKLKLLTTYKRKLIEFTN